MSLTEAYSTAEKLAFHNRAALIRDLRIRPEWTEEGFRYTPQAGDGRDYLVVPAAGTRTPVEALPAEAPGHSLAEVPSPDGKLAAFKRGHDIWIRSLEDGAETRLTIDGEPHHDYGTVPESLAPWTLMGRLGIAELAPALAWSADSARILTHRSDHRGVREQSLIEDLPADGGAPRTVTKRYPFPGDEHTIWAEPVVLDIASGTVVRGDGERHHMPLMSPIQTKWMWWGEDGAVYYLTATRDHRSLSLHRMDAATGATVMILTEKADTRVEPGQVPLDGVVIGLFNGCHELLWYSQRDGWGHLYLYDALTGEFRAQVTSGEFGVRRILKVDEAAREVYFLAAGLTADDPYVRSVFKARLDGSRMEPVVHDGLDHAVQVAPDGSYFIDSASSITTPPVHTVRGWDGEVLVELGSADITDLVAAGWTPPVPFTAKAADGVTDVYGVLHLPPGFDPANSYPVLDHPYPGPQMNRVSHFFAHDIFTADAESTAALGFVVMAVDGRGTPGRSKAFHDATYRELHRAGSLEDHVAALGQLARTRPWLDLSRVGIFGNSGGGYASLRALLDHGDTYKAAVSVSGNHDDRYYHLAWGEVYGSPENDPAVYSAMSNVENLERLRGKLLLIHGGMDDNVFPHQSLRAAERLIRLGKDFELLVIPGGDHILLGYEDVWLKRKWDFLVEHVMGERPPVYRPARPEINMEIVAAFFS